MMLTNDDQLIRYKQIDINSQGKLKFFLDKHSTQEGTWGMLTLQQGSIDFVFLDGEHNELARQRVNNDKPTITIPPATWHKIELVSAAFAACLEFYCMPHRYWHKKHGLNEVHKELLYVYNTYLNPKQSLNILDVGCGYGRNPLFLAAAGHYVTGIDVDKASIDSVNNLAYKESLSNIQTIQHDLNQPLPLLDTHYDLVTSLVSLQFLQAHRVPDLLNELQSVTVTNGLHLLVFPVQDELYPLPPKFTFLPASQELYHFYQDQGWSILEYKESVGKIYKKDEAGQYIQGLFGFLLAQKVI